MRSGAGDVCYHGGEASSSALKVETQTAPAKQNMDRQSEQYFLRTSEGFEVAVTIDATGKYYSNLRTKAPPDSTKSQFDRAMREVDIWLEDTFGTARNKMTRLEKAPLADIHRLKGSKQSSKAACRKHLAKMRKKDRRKS